MRTSLLLVLAALPALAQPPAEFRASAPIQTTKADALHQVELPFEAYGDARPDLGDIRVFNAAGESVPIAWAGPPDVVLESAPPAELPVFPISRLEATGSGPRSEVTVRTGDGTLVSIKGKGGASPATVARPAAYVLDASRLQEPTRALVFDWKATPGNEVVTLRIHSSDDLKSWSPIAAAPIVRLESAGRALTQPRVEFVPRKVKYFRVSWDAPGFVLGSVHAEAEPRGKLPGRHKRIATATPGKNEGELVYDLGARLPVAAIRLVPAQENGVVSASFYVGDTAQGPWRFALANSFYRLRRDQEEVLSPPLEIGNRAARYWMVRLAAGSSGGPPPTLEAEWRSARLVFVAQGEGPYHLAFGNAKATSTALPVSTLMPKYEKGAELMLPEARLGAVRAGPPPTRWETMVADVSPRRVALWAILVAGVVALGFMAWRLMRQVK